MKLKRVMCCTVSLYCIWAECGEGFVGEMVKGDFLITSRVLITIERVIVSA